MNRPFLLDPAHTDFIAGRSARLRGPKVIAVPALMLMVAVGLGFAGFGARDWWWDHLLRTQGQHGQARVLGKRVSESDDSTTYFVRYELALDAGRTVIDERSVGEARYGRIEVGAPIEVLYLASDPSRTQPVGEESGGHFIAAFGLLFAVGSGIGVVLGFRERKRLRRLARLGRVVPGVLLHASLDEDEGTFTLEVSYEFRLRGECISGEAKRTRNDLKDRPLPSKGTPIAVLVTSDGEHFVL